MPSETIASCQRPKLSRSFSIEHLEVVVSGKYNSPVNMYVIWREFYKYYLILKNYIRDLASDMSRYVLNIFGEVLTLQVNGI